MTFNHSTWLDTSQGNWDGLGWFAVSNLLVIAVGDQNLRAHHGVHCPWG